MSQNQTRKISVLYQVAKCSNTSKLYTLKALLSKNRFYLFFRCFLFFKFNMPCQKSGNILDKKTVLIRLKIKAICLTKKTNFLKVVIKISVFSN